MTTQVPDYIVTPWTGGEVLHCCPPIYGPQAIWTPKFVSNSTACQRGYTARWRIANDRLFLDDAWGTVEPEEFPRKSKLPLPQWASKLLHRPPMSKKFYCNDTVQCSLADFYGRSDPVFADWVTMELRVPKDGQTTRHMYGAYLCIEVKGGLVTRSPRVENIDFILPDFLQRATC